MNKASLNRIFFYTIGLLILAMGLTLNTKANLGVSPIISIPYCFSQIFHLNFGNATLVLYCIFVVIEILLHLLGGKRSSPQRKNNERFVLIMDLLQIPLSIVFTRFMNIFSAIFPICLQDQTIPDCFCCSWRSWLPPLCLRASAPLCHFPCVLSLIRETAWYRRSLTVPIKAWERPKTVLTSSIYPSRSASDSFCKVI